MKHTGQNPSVKALSAPYRACTALHDKKNTVHVVTIQNRACGVSLSGLLISNRDIATGDYPTISGWVLIRSPFAHFKRGKSRAVYVRAQICSRKIPGTLLLLSPAILQSFISNRTFKQSITALCFGNGYFR